MASTLLRLASPRDLDLFAALERSPLTVRQILKLSRTFAYPFTSERRVQERLKQLCATGRVLRWPYATAGQGALSYCTLSPLGYRLLHPAEEFPSHKGLFRRVGVARQGHVYALAEAIVHLLACAHAAGVSVAEFHRENSLRLERGGESLYPDAAFTLTNGGGTRFRFFVELDNATETIHGAGSVETWRGKVAFYERYQDQMSERFRVLAVTTGSSQRLRHLLASSAAASHNRQRSLVYGITLANLLGEERALDAWCFQNHRGEFVALAAAHTRGPVAAVVSASQPTPALVASASCPQPLSPV